MMWPKRPQNPKPNGSTETMTKKEQKAIASVFKAHLDSLKDEDFSWQAEDTTRRLARDMAYKLQKESPTSFDFHHFLVEAGL